jgi:hypothetical protein
MGGCADGETEIVKDTNSFDKSKGARACTGGTQRYCCKGFTPVPSGSDLKTQAEDAAKAAAKLLPNKRLLTSLPRRSVVWLFQHCLPLWNCLRMLFLLLVSSTSSSTLPLPSLCHFQFKADYCPCRRDLGHCRDYYYPSTHQSVCQGRRKRRPSRIQGIRQRTYAFYGQTNSYKRVSAYRIKPLDFQHQLLWEYCKKSR